MDAIEDGPERTSAQGRRTYPRPPVLTARALVLLIPGVIALALLVIAAPELWTFMIGALYMVAVYPAVQALARRGLNRGVAILLIFAVTIVLFALFAIFVAGPLVGQLAAFVAVLPDLLVKLVAWLHDALNALGVGLPPDAQDALRSLLAKVVEAVEGIVLDLTGGLIATGFSLVGAALAFLIVPFWVFYIMNSWPRVSSEPRPARPARVATRSPRRHGHRRDLLRELAAGTAQGGRDRRCLRIHRVPDPGCPGRSDLSRLRAAPRDDLLRVRVHPQHRADDRLHPTALRGTLVGPVGVIAVIIGFIVAQQLENAVIIPRIQGRANDLHPAVILFVLVVGGAIFGILGIILSVPVTATAVRLTRYFFGRASGEPPGSPAS